MVNGIEKIIRLLVLPKRNYCIALKRSANAKRGPSYSDKAVAMRCVRADMTSMTLRVHYLNDGRATVAFTLRKREYFIPVALLLRVRSLDGAHTVLLGYWPLRYGEVVSESCRGSSELGEGVESERGMWTSLLHSAAPPRDARVSALLGVPRNSPPVCLDATSCRLEQSLSLSRRLCLLGGVSFTGAGGDDGPGDVRPHRGGVGRGGAHNRRGPHVGGGVENRKCPRNTLNTLLCACELS